MTLTDPLLKELKGHIGALAALGQRPYTDDDEPVFLICHTLESIFLKGLNRHDGFTPWRTDCFQWFHQLVRKYNRVLPLTFRGAFDDIMNDRKTRTNTGKTRLLIRHCLKRKCLHTPVQYHIDKQDFRDMTLKVNYNPSSSVLGHEILAQIFLSLLLQLSHYDFSLDLINSSFLDESWQIPKLFKTEVVPCEKLGLTLGFPMGFAVIVEILEHSLAAEFTDKIEIGDIIDEFNGTPVRNFYGSKLESLFRKCKKMPFKITFIKSKDPENGQIFLPAIKLYRILGMDPELLNYPEPAYRRRPNRTLEKPEFDMSCANPDRETDAILNQLQGCENRSHITQLQENAEVHEQLIDVEVDVEKQNLSENSLVTSNYLDLLSSMVDNSSASVFHSSGIATLPDLLSDDQPAQLILESNENDESNSNHNEELENELPVGNQLKTCQYYDDSHPFLV